MSKELSREDVLLDLYKIHAYNPNDAIGNPLTPFGNFCEGYKTCEVQQDKVITELKAQIEMYQKLIGERQPAKYREAIAELVEALEDARDSVQFEMRSYKDELEYESREETIRLYEYSKKRLEEIDALIAKHKGQP